MPPPGGVGPAGGAARKNSERARQMAGGPATGGPGAGHTDAGPEKKKMPPVPAEPVE